eukprot:GFUD01044707.1.p2 GENE.GFUD01044707.1~~GFUD01044707.1.p2  ORF type:complete len:181 (-),score=32.93 GFUD01044707.1:51-593(-)
MMILLVISCLASLAMAEAEADPWAHYYPTLHNVYPNWPGVSGLGFSSTCYGCYGKKKRSAEPHYGYGYPLAYGYLPHAPVHGPGVAGHPGGATSYVAGSGPGIGKRSADAEPHGFVPYALPYSVRGIDQVHPGGGHSVQHVALGVGKRSANAEPAFQNYGVPYALAHAVVPSTAYGVHYY